MIQIFPLAAIDEVRPGSDLSALLADAITSAGLTPEAGDVLVVTSKIISKAEGRFVYLAEDSLIGASPALVGAT